MDETEAVLLAGPSTPAEDERWAGGLDPAPLERDFDSFREYKEAVEFLLKDFSTAESNEDVEEDTEDVCSTGASGAADQEVVDWGWAEGAPSDRCVWSDGAAGGDTGSGGSGSAAGEDGDDVWDNPFFSEEWEDRDSRLPMGVAPGLLLKVSPEV